MREPERAMKMTELPQSVEVSAAADPLAALLSGDYFDAGTGQRVGVETRALVIRRSLAGSEAEIVAGLGFGRRLAVVSDPATFGVLGQRVEKALAGHFDIDSVVLPAGPEPDAATVAKVRAASASADALIAVGSGTINDLAKYASALDGKPYAVFGTAPSMNGFTSLTASITVDGHKKTLPAQAPAGAFFDLDVLSAAPARLIHSGLGDSICRSTAQWDWLLSHLLFGTPYRQLPFDLLRDDEAALVEHAADLLKGDTAIMELLVRTLVLSGFGTAIVGSSAPASQGEHLVSHYIDMFGPAQRPPVFHGEQVGVTTLSLARLQDRMLDTAPVFVADPMTGAEFRSRYGDELGASMWPEFAEKRLDAQRADELNHRIETGWTRIGATLAAIQLPTDNIERALRAAGAPTRPEEIHLDREFYDAALRHGREIRNRYTALDLAAQTGRLGTLLPTL
jgi:glycerol-1-phosphate dehydrogenase [NAD(P)+]